MSELSLQQRYSPESTCFGCGPANAHGLQIASFAAARPAADSPAADSPAADSPAADPPATGPTTDPDVNPGELIADWQPLPHHAAFDDVLNGGIIGALLDCHSNWAAAIHLMHETGAAGPPGCVTAEMTVRFRRPTRVHVPVRLRAWPVSTDGQRVIVDAQVLSGGIVTATCHAIFVAVGPDHPAFERW